MTFTRLSLGNGKRLIVTGGALLVLALPFVLKLYVVTGSSMEPAYAHGDYMLVENISPRLFGLSRGSVVVFKDPRHPQHPIIVKRVIGLPNETVRISEDVVTIVHEDGKEEVLSEEWLADKRGNGAPLETKLGPEDYFLMGDNRDQSEDSRHWGTIQPHEMIGQPLFRL